MDKQYIAKSLEIILVVSNEATHQSTITLHNIAQITKNRLDQLMRSAICLICNHFDSKSYLVSYLVI